MVLCKRQNFVTSCHHILRLIIYCRYMSKGRDFNKELRKHKKKILPEIIAEKWNNVFYFNGLEVTIWPSREY